MLTKFFKSELFLCLLKVDHVMSCKEPIKAENVIGRVLYNHKGLRRGMCKL